MLFNTTSTLARRSVSNACAACHQLQRRAAHKLVEVELLTDVPALGRRGEHVIVSPGLARNRLLPNKLGLYVVRGKGVSPLRDAAAREQMLRQAASLMRPAGAVSASRVFDQVTEGQEDAQVASESELVASLSLLPQPLIFSRLTHSSSGSHGAKELFGSVSVGDVLAELKDFGIRLEENQCSFIEEEGIQNGRVKSLGKFAFAVQLRALDQTELLKVEVVKESKE